jgi:pheromone shutdown-related protein TraB
MSETAINASAPLELPQRAEANVAERTPPAQGAPAEHVTTLTRDGRTFHLIGTAHISAKSVEEVRRVIEQVRPDAVCVELCETRFEAMNDDERWKKLNIFDVIRQGKVLYLLANVALSAYQTALGERFGVKPGAEQREGIAVAKEVGAELVLADRNIQATLKRTWANIPFWRRFTLLAELFEPAEEVEELSEERLEAMKDHDTISEMMKAFAEALPEVKRPLIDERDEYLISSVLDAPGQTVVAVVGAGHVEGMVHHFHAGTITDREALSVIPQTALWVRSLKWLIPALVMGLFYVGYQKNMDQSFEQMLWAWVLPNALLSALFSLAALPKPLSVITAAVAAPITSLNPAIGAGMVVGFMEAWLRKPTVEDAERVISDAATMKGLYRNPFTRVLLVAVLSTIGSALGTYIGLGWVVSLAS